MTLVMGIDTGGTYTDGVILDVQSQRVLAKSKVMTTHDNLILCIDKCFQGLKCDAIKDVQMVALSTTLATNAVVEGRGGEAGLLLIGYQPMGDLPVKIYDVIRGGHDVHGRLQTELDVDGLYNSVRSFKGKVEAVAISSFFSIRNPEHEQKARDVVRELLGVPVVCGHELSRSLGFHERAVTAALNARLLPIIASLIGSVKQVLNKEGLNVPLMIVKGDGSLMSEDLARERPIETLLSGPAASIFGATFLAKEKDALVLDMGGTTTDIAVLKHGVPKVNSEEATVGGWATKVRAAKINTYGVGGDSHMNLHKSGKLHFGPLRVWPLALATDRYPNILEELEMQLQVPSHVVTYSGLPVDCYMLTKESIPDGLSENERRIVDTLHGRAHTWKFLNDNLHIDTLNMNLRRLVDVGIVGKASLTPTDIVIARGNYDHPGGEASRLGVKILARDLKRGYRQLLDEAMEAIIDEVSASIMDTVINMEDPSIKLDNEAGARYFVDKLLRPKKGDLFDCKFSFKLPMVAIGAPVKAYLPRVARKLNMSLTIPHYSEIANAIGAASGNVIETVEILIKPERGSFVVHAPWAMEVLSSFDEAVEFASEQASKKAKLQIKKAGAASFELNLSREDVVYEEKDIFLESRISATAIGRPKWVDVGFI